MKKVIRKIRSKVVCGAGVRGRTCVSGSKSGSALLVAILVMGVLMVLTLGMSDLVIREIRQTKDLVASGKAYFSAEAGIENALLDLHENAPGYQTNGKDGTPGKVDFPADPKSNPDFHYSYQILNQADSIPSFDPDQLVWLSSDGKIVSPNSAGAMPTSPNNLPAAATYNSLALNGSIVIPLSTPNGNSGLNDVQKFIVEYYFPWEGLENLNLSDSVKQNLDILRWKVFGYPKNAGGTADSSMTDSISDFYPAVSTNNASLPGCIGTDDTIDPTCTKIGYAQGKSYNWSGAHECYLTDSNSQKAQSSGLDPIQKVGNDGQNPAECTIANFVQNHTQNYLVLTNVLNPAVLEFSQQDIAAGRANIYYRVLTDGKDKLVRQSASIKADGFALNDQYLQSIDVNIGLSSFLPVFNFSLYGTDSSKNAASQPSGLLIVPNVVIDINASKNASKLQVNPIPKP